MAENAKIPLENLAARSLSSASGDVLRVSLGERPLFFDITSDDWRRSLARALRTDNAVARQIREVERRMRG